MNPSLWLLVAVNVALGAGWLGWRLGYARHKRLCALLHERDMLEWRIARNYNLSFRQNHGDEPAVLPAKTGVEL